MKATNINGIRAFTHLEGNNEIPSIRIPNYQRLYRWKPEQINELWNSIEECCSESVESYFMGSILLQKKENDSPYEVVDGQQRMLTLSMLSIIIRSLIGQSSLNLNDDDDYLGLILGLTSIAYNNKKLRIIVQDKNLEDYKNLMQDEMDLNKTYQFLNKLEKDQKEIFDRESKNEEDIDDESKFIEYIENKEKLSTIYRNALLLFIKVKNYININNNNPQSLILLAKILVKKFMFVQIVLDKNEDALKIFQTMNSLGLDLTFSDIIKSMLIDKNEKIADKWKELFEPTETDDDIVFWEKEITSGKRRKYIEDFFLNFIIACSEDFVGKKNDDSHQEEYRKKISKYSKEEIIKEWLKIEEYAKQYETIHTYDCNNIIDYSRPNYSYLLRLLSLLKNYRALCPVIMHLECGSQYDNKEVIYKNLATIYIKEVVAIGEFKNKAIPSSLQNIDPSKRGQWEDLFKSFLVPRSNNKCTKLLHALHDKLYLEREEVREKTGTYGQSCFASTGIDALSLEHFYPKSKGNDFGDGANLVESIGNKTILNLRVNTRFKDNLPKEKLEMDTISSELNRFLINTKEKHKDLELTSNWDKESIKAREKALLELANKYFS